MTENLGPEQGQHKTLILVPESEGGTLGQPFYGKHNAQTTKNEVTPSCNLVPTIQKAQYYNYYSKRNTLCYYYRRVVILAFSDYSLFLGY